MNDNKPHSMMSDDERAAIIKELITPFKRRRTLKSIITRWLDNIALGIFFAGGVVSWLWLQAELFLNRKQREEFHASLNHDKTVVCFKCGRLPEMWEEAFPHGICEDCFWED